MPKVTINGHEIEVERGTSIIQAAEMLGVEIPRFCYHDRLSVPANCRMCLVEVEGGPPKPVASCAMACGEGMVVHTDSPMVKKARKGVMEMLLINHPLDCPICDQGGECDLQDQAVAYGMDRSRFYENKRAVKDKELGPLIETVMTRCINCTRCVRFAEEVAGAPVLGQFNRGEDAEIGTFIGDIVSTELSGNLIDICPVGALTSKPYAFQARAWELRKTETVDVHDALGCNIRVDARGGEVMRVLPRLHEEINEEWIDDRTRFSYDGLKKKRLDRPYVRDKDTGKLRETSWNEAFTLIAEKMNGVKGSQMAALVGDLAAVEEVVALKDLMESFDCPNLDCRTDGAAFDTTLRTSWLFNSGIAGVDQADAILLVGTNPRLEATLLNARIRRNWMERGVKIGVIGEAADLTYTYDHLGTGPKDLEKLISSKTGFAKVLKEAQKPMIIIGSGAFAREDGAEIHTLTGLAAEKLGFIKEGWNGFNVLHRAASRAGALLTGFLPHGEDALDFKGIVAATKKGGIKVLYLLGADEFDVKAQIGWKTFTIYQGHHGDKGAARADVILPGSAYTEKDGMYVNTEGRVQLSKRAVFPPGEAKEDWKILRALSDYVGKPLHYNTLSELRAQIRENWSVFEQVDTLPHDMWISFGAKSTVLDTPFHSPVSDYYRVNSITRASITMQKCAESFGAKAMAEAAE